MSDNGEPTETQTPPQPEPQRPVPEIKPDPGLATVDERGATIPFTKEQRDE